MPKYKGSDFLIQMEVTPGGGTYQTVTGLETNQLSINNEAVDVTDKGDMPWRTLLAAGVRSMEVGGSGNFTDGAIIAAVQAAALSGSVDLKFKLTSGRGDQFIGAFQVTSFQRSGEKNNSEKYNLSLSSNGVVAYTAAP